MRRAAVLALSAVLCGAPGLLQAQNGGPSGAALTEQVSRDSAAPRTVAMVYQGIFNYVRIERAEDGAAPNLHPLEISEEDLTSLLVPIRLGTKPLFNQDDLEEIVPHLVKALARAQAGQDISFAVAGRHSGFGWLAARDVTTARLFNTPAGLQLIVGLAHRRFEDQFKATGTIIPFEPGRRAGPLPDPVSLKLAGAAGAQVRADWVVLKPTAMAQAAMPMAPAAPAMPAVPAAPEQAAPPPAAQATPATPAVQPPAAAAATGTTAPARPAASAPGADARYRDASERLKTIERLRAAGLISQQEYDDKRKQILQDL
jgi:hypothetical protein